MDELVKSLRICADGENCDQCAKWDIKQNGGRNACEYAICTEAADAIEELQATLCNWCAVCPEDKRDLSTCEIYESCHAEGGSMNSVEIELDNFSTTIGTSCQICDSFIPIIDIKDGYPRICEKCKKRLKKLLYESHEGE